MSQRNENIVESNPRGVFCAVRLVNTLYDIRPMRVNNHMSLETIERYIRDLFSDTYSDLDDYRMQMYTDRHLRLGIYNVLLWGAADVYEGALITAVLQPRVKRTVPICSYDYKVAHMVHSRSRFIEANSS